MTTATGQSRPVTPYDYRMTDEDTADTENGDE